MAIGIPGSGKTTFMRPFAERYGFAYINRDDLREEILGDATDHSQDPAIWDEANRRAQEALHSHPGVVLDGTYIEPTKRCDVLELLREGGATQIIGIVADVSIETALENNAKRHRVVDASFIQSLHELLHQTPPSIDEGFDALLTFEEFKAREQKLF